MKTQESAGTKWMDRMGASCLPKVWAWGWPRVHICAVPSPRPTKTFCESADIDVHRAGAATLICARGATFTCALPMPSATCVSQQDTVDAQELATRNWELALKVKLDTPSLGELGTTVSLFGFDALSAGWPNMVATDRGERRRARGSAGRARGGEAPRDLKRAARGCLRRQRACTDWC